MKATSIFLASLAWVSPVFAQSDACITQDNVTTCCNAEPHWSGQGQYIGPCDCMGRGYDECTELEARSLCQWQTNATMEAECQSKTNSTSCFASNNCNWMEDMSGQAYCMPLLCQDRPCGSLAGFADSSTACRSRPDCLWSDVDSHGECVVDTKCACINPEKLAQYCPCQKTSSQCETVLGCYWSSLEGCTNHAPPASSAGERSLPSMAAIAIGVAALLLH